MSKQKGTAWAAMEMVNLCGACPPIERMDSSILGLKASRHLALSTNSIDKIGPLTGLSLETLSMGRNCLKRIENLEGVAPTLRQLWISYNSIEKLVGFWVLGISWHIKSSPVLLLACGQRGMVGSLCSWAQQPCVVFLCPPSSSKQPLLLLTLVQRSA